MSTTVLHNPAIQPATQVNRPTLLQRLWAALEAQGRRRAVAEMRRVAILHVSTDPELSRKLREAADQTARA